jgi:hypothetical protein
VRRVGVLLILSTGEKSGRATYIMIFLQLLAVTVWVKGKGVFALLSSISHELAF